MTFFELVPWLVIGFFIALASIAMRQRRSNKTLKDILERDSVKQDTDFSAFGTTKDGEKLVKCPYCAEWIKQEAKVCKHCGRDVAASIQESIAAQKSLQESLREDAEKRTVEYLQKQELKKQQLAAYRRTPKFILTVSFSTVLILVLAAVTIWFGLQPSLEQEKLANYKPLNLTALAIHWQQSLNSCSFPLNGAKPVVNGGKLLEIGTMSGAYSKNNVWEMDGGIRASGNQTLHLYITSKNADAIDCVTKNLFGKPASTWDDTIADFGKEYSAESTYNSTGEVYFLDLTWTHKAS